MLQERLVHYPVSDHSTSNQSYIFKVECHKKKTYTLFAVHNVCPCVGIFVCVMMLHFENVRLS